MASRKSSLSLVQKTISSLRLESGRPLAEGPPEQKPSAPVSYVDPIHANKCNDTVLHSPPQFITIKRLVSIIASWSKDMLKGARVITDLSSRLPLQRHSPEHLAECQARGLERQRTSLGDRSRGQQNLDHCHPLACPSQSDNNQE